MPGSGNRTARPKVVGREKLVREGRWCAWSERFSILKDLVRTTCHSADTGAAAIQATTDPYWTMLLEQIREDHRLLLVDLVRCLLLRGTPVPEVRTVMTEVVGPVEPEVGFDLLRFDLEIAERKLELALRRVLADTLVSQSTLELLSLHYLRLQPRLQELDELSRRPAPAYAGLPQAVSSSLH